MCNSEILANYCQEARRLLPKFSNHRLEHIERIYNAKCDALAKNKIISGYKNDEPNAFSSLLAFV